MKNPELVVIEDKKEEKSNEVKIVENPLTIQIPED